MAQAGVAYCYTASVQPVQSRRRKASKGSAYGAKPKNASDAARRVSGGKSGSQPVRDGRPAAASGRSRHLSGSAPSGKSMPYSGSHAGTDRQKNIDKKNTNVRPESGSVRRPNGTSARKPVGVPPKGGSIRTGTQYASPNRRKSPYPMPKKNPPNIMQKERQLRLRELRRRERINRIMLGAAGFLIVAALFAYIGRMAEISGLSKQADVLRAEITELREQKQYKEVKLAASQDLVRVRDTATGRLGMIEPSPEQIRYISIGGYSEQAE